MNNKKIIVLSLSFITFGIMLGAIGAHYLEKIGIAETQIKSFATGTTYLFYNGIGLLALAGLTNQFNFEIKTQYRFILWGTLLFSGSIFGLVILPKIGIEINKVLGPITPIGGMLMILGWGTLLVKYLATYKST